MSLPADEQLSQEKSFLLGKQVAVETMVADVSKKMKQADIPEAEKKQFKTAAKQLRQGFALLKKTTTQYYRNKLELNNLLEQLNSYIAHIQTISLSKVPSQTLRLSFLTRVTADYIKHHQGYLRTVTALYLNAGEKMTSPKNLDNQLFSLPANFHLLTSLEILQVRYNRLATFPAALSHLRSLKALGFEGNRLKQLPASICRLKNLEELGLANNKLTSLPDEIGKLSKLKVLRLESNLLTSLPSAVSKLKQLITLGLTNNFLFELPDLSKLTKLQTVVVKQNLLTAFPLVSARSQVKVDAAKNAFKLACAISHKPK